MRAWHPALTFLLLTCLAAVPLYAASDLVAHWSFDEPDVATARDLSGNGHDAALKNVEFVPSPRGHALRFDSRDDLAAYGQRDTMNLSGDMTLAVWVKTDSSVEPNTNRLIFGDDGLGVDRNMNLRMDGYGYLRFEWANGRDNASLLAPNTLLNGTWKHVVVTCDCPAKVATMYVDGEQVAQMPMPLPISPAPAKNRLTGWFYNGFFQGDLDDVALYSRAMSEAEVKRLFESQADLQVGRSRVLFDATAPTPRGVVSVPVHNWSKQAREVEVSAAPERPAQHLTIKPGGEADLVLGYVPLRPVWQRRTDLMLCEAPADQQKVTFTTRLGDTTDVQPVDLAAQLILEPISVRIEDPWQKQMKSGPTVRLEGEVNLAVPTDQLRTGTLRLALVSRETGHTVLRTAIKPRAHVPVVLDVAGQPWGAYDLKATFEAGGVQGPISASAPATILPGGPQQLRVLNNLVTELMDAKARGLLKSKQITFMNPRQGWVWINADCALQLDGKTALAAGESMRLLPAGNHVLTITGTPTDLQVRAIPGLLYNVYPSGPQIAPFGANTWERLRKYTLANTNMIESQVIDTPEYQEWVAQGKLWIANIQAPGLIDKEEWTPEKMLEVWLHPRDWDLAKINGIQSDEYYPGIRTIKETALSVAKLAEDPAFAGKLWIPFVVNMYGSQVADLFMKITMGADWPFSIEVYQGEAPTEQQNRDAIAARFGTVANGWESAYPGALRHAIFTPMYAYLPYCTSNCYPQADFRVHLDMQMQCLATDPAYFGLWGVQPYRSNYVDEEILHCMGRMLRHYCIEGQTDRMMSDPYELRYVTDPDFVDGLQHWQAAAAEAGGITAGSFKGYGILQGRYPGGAFGDTFAILKRSAKGPNVLSQALQGLKPGRLYSLKVYTGDHADLTAGKSRKDQQVLTIKLDGAEVQPGAFSYPFHSARGPAPFTRQAPFWMTYHWQQFRAQGETAKLSLSDWAKPDAAVGPTGQETMVSFVEVQPVLE